MSGARVMVENINHPVLTTNAGEYWRILRPGTYVVMAVSRDGRARSRKVPVNITRGQTEIVNLSLSV